MAELIFGHLILAVQVAVCKRRYRTIIKRIRDKKLGGKIRVVFMSDNVSKWKCQSLYDKMDESSVFDPLILISMKPHEMNNKLSDRERIVRERCLFFKRLGDKYKLACNPNTMEFFDLSEFSPDIVFFQEPWLLPKNQNVISISRYALTCYVPYAYEIGFDKRLTCMRRFHRLMWMIFAADAEHAQLYMKNNRGWKAAGKSVSFGYPPLDYYNEHDQIARTDYVIYAPHFSFKINPDTRILRLGTFEWNGVQILNYAKNHNEVKWFFKPHPGLYNMLINSGFMTTSEAKRYYDEWGKIGAKCNDGDYMRYFLKARALITDCGSFLAEFVPTGMPIIRMISADCNLEPTPRLVELLETYYTARSWDELKQYLDEIVLGGADPKKDIRLAAARKQGLIGNNAARNIISFLRKILQ